MVAGFLVICCRRTIPSTKTTCILRLGTSCVVSIPSSGSSPSCESDCIVDNLLRKWINFNLSLHCSIVPSAEKGLMSLTRDYDEIIQDNNHEEADTLLIYHAVLASQVNQPDAQMVFFSPDTYILMLVIANYDLMLKNTSISMASGVMRIDPIWRAIRPETAKAFPAFHVFTGADNTGRFSRIGKATWLQVYMKADRDVISSLQMLSTEAEVTQTMLANLASFVCAAYSPKGININTIFELRWYLVCKHMAESDKLPPTLVALRQHVLRVHIQARVWGQASIALQELQLDPLKNGHHKDSEGQLKSTMTDALPAPKAIIEMVSCHCKTDCSSARCSCRTNNLSCTDLCRCGSECQNDEYTQNKHETDDDDDDDNF